MSDSEVPAEGSSDKSSKKTPSAKSADRKDAATKADATSKLAPKDAEIKKEAKAETVSSG